MKIWFDLTNSPHVHFFRGMMSELVNEGHDVVITTRDQANTLGLLDLYGFKYQIIGKSYGKKLRHKIVGNISRVISLVRFLRRQKIDVAISQSSFTSPIAGFFAGIPTVYTNDNEHAMGNKIAFLFATKIFIPEFISLSRVVNLFVHADKVTQYPGVKEGIYLWRRDWTKNECIRSRPKLYYRPEPYFAQYYKGEANKFDKLLIEMKQECDIVVLPRDSVQLKHFSEDVFSGITVCENPKTFDDIVQDCDLFIGAGGTMTREMAVVGTPTISVYQDKLLDVDSYLIENGLMMYRPDLTSESLRQVLVDMKSVSPSRVLFEKGKIAYSMIKSQLLQYNYD